MSPIQLYTAGILENFNSCHSAIDSIINQNELPSYDPDQSVPIDSDAQVFIPEITAPVSNNLRQSIFEQCNPLEDNGENGVQLYIRCIQILTIASTVG